MVSRPEWYSKISQPVHQDIIDEHDISVPMRDGVVLAVDVHRPKSEDRFPALLAYQPWGKDHDSFGRHFPHQRRPSGLWDGSLESGDTEFIVSRGYVHVIADARGTGASEGEIPGIMGAGGKGEGQDIFDTIEWIAAQPWCDGNVGMIGISYLAAVQLVAAAERPPHLKAIFAEAGHFDAYRNAYHGGILWQMPRAALRGRGGDSGLAIKQPFSLTERLIGSEAYRELLQERLQDPDIRYHPNYHQLMHYPELDPVWVDYLANPHDNDFWQQGGTLEERAAKIDIPVHLGVQVGRGWQLDETLKAFEGVRGFKQLAIRPGPPMQERPFHEFHDEIVRWYDHWLKGSDTGLLDEPSITVALEGTTEVMHLEEWPPPNIEWTELYLRPGKRLMLDPEQLDGIDAPPDGYYQPPLRVTDYVGSVTYSTKAFQQPTDIVGPAALQLWAEIDTEDTNWFVNLVDVAPNGSETPLTMGLLKASHRELVDEKSEPWYPVHPHTRSIPVTPGEVVEYSVLVFPILARIAAGHRLKLEIRSVEDPSTVNQMLPPEAGHVNSGRATTHKIYRDRDHQSHLLLPFLRG